MDLTDLEYHGDRWLSPAEVAKRLKFNVKTIQRWCREGLIPARRIGRRRFVIDWEQLRRKHLPCDMVAATPYDLGGDDGE